MMLEIAISVFLGYILGRIGDRLAGHWDFIHHWVWGVFCIVFGIFFRTNAFFFYVGFLGIGLVISDLNDLLHFRLYWPDEKANKSFWGFD